MEKKYTCQYSYDPYHGLLVGGGGPNAYDSLEICSCVLESFSTVTPGLV